MTWVASLLVAFGGIFFGVIVLAIASNLHRIADALEAQNSLHASWYESQEPQEGRF